MALSVTWCGSWRWIGRCPLKVFMVRSKDRQMVQVVFTVPHSRSSSSPLLALLPTSGPKCPQRLAMDTQALTTWGCPLPFSMSSHFSPTLAAECDGCSEVSEPPHCSLHWCFRRTGLWGHLVTLLLTSCPLLPQPLSHLCKPISYNKRMGQKKKMGTCGKIHRNKLRVEYDSPLSFHERSSWKKKCLDTLSDIISKADIVIYFNLCDLITVSKHFFSDDP